jgi:flagellar export protein FliJ
MKTFRFPLEKVLDWRQLQMRTEEERLAALQNQSEGLTRKIDALTTAELNSKMSLLGAGSVQGSDLHALMAFQTRIKKERTSLAAEKLQCERRIAAQRGRLLKARKDARILEKLRERRLDAWTYEFDRELDEAAADAHISRLIRGES